MNINMDIMDTNILYSLQQPSRKNNNEKSNEKSNEESKEKSKEIDINNSISKEKSNDKSNEIDINNSNENSNKNANISNNNIDNINNNTNIDKNIIDNNSNNSNSINNNDSNESSSNKINLNIHNNSIQSLKIKSDFDFSDTDENILFNNEYDDDNEEEIDIRVLKKSKINNNIEILELESDINCKIESTSRVGLIYSKELFNIADFLLNAYKLLNDEKLLIIPPNKAEISDLLDFHSEEYIDQLLCKNFDKLKCSEYNLLDDCHPFSDLSEYILWTTGASLTACNLLKSGDYSIAINWTGGWHHSKPSTASGYCFINDVVLSILTLQSKFPKVLYIDVDAHHGDGVQDAFYSTNDVFTLSFHYKEKGFFPGGGGMEEIGVGRGKYYSMNIPLPIGVNDDTYENIFKLVALRVIKMFEPDAIVFQSGCDLLSFDVGHGNLTAQFFKSSLTACTQTNIPMLVLGGGGYIPVSTARCWTSATAALINKELSDNIPADFPDDEEVSKTFLSFAPSFKLKIDKSLIKEDPVNMNEIENKLKEYELYLKPNK